jgi:hypothetical protein
MLKSFIFLLCGAIILFGLMLYGDDIDVISTFFVGHLGSVVHILMIIIFLYVILNILFDVLSARLVSIRLCARKLFNKLDNKSPYIFNDNVKCFMLYGDWGSGKTYQYKNNIRHTINENDTPYPVEVSCFSADKEELIVQLIETNPVYRMLSLHSLLSKLLIKNWREFMPKNKVIVFDDVERLHRNDGSYVDLIAVIDYLKQNNKILLICNRDSIKEDIFNEYIERVVDKYQEVDVCHLKRDILKIENREYLDIICDEVEELYKKDNSPFKNIRIIERVWPEIVGKCINFLNQLNIHGAIAREACINYRKTEIIKTFKFLYMQSADYNMVEKIGSAPDHQENVEIKEFNLSENDVKNHYKSGGNYGFMYESSLRSKINFKYELITHMLSDEFLFIKFKPLKLFSEMMSHAINCIDDQDFDKIPIEDYKNKLIKDLDFGNIDIVQIRQYFIDLLNEADLISGDIDRISGDISSIPTVKAYSFSNQFEMALLITICKHHKLADYSSLSSLFDRIMRKSSFKGDNTTKDKPIWCVYCVYETMNNKGSRCGDYILPKYSILFFDLDKSINQIIEDIQSYLDTLWQQYFDLIPELSANAP